MARKPVEQPTYLKSCTIYVSFPQEDYYENKENMRRSIDSLRRWPKQNLAGVVLENALDLCSKKRQWAKLWEHRRCHRTSNMLDRLIAPK